MGQEFGQAMRILVAQIYGLGNAILTTPLIMALAKMGDKKNRTHEVHVVVDPKRKAAIEILKNCPMDYSPEGKKIPAVKKVWNMNEFQQIRAYHFDVLIMCCDHKPLVDRFAIPRVEWAYLRKGGLDRVEWFQQWKKHEMEVAFDAARLFGYQGEMPVPYVPMNESMKIDFEGPKLAIGIGYYKGDSWSKKKHWGNRQFAEIAKRLQMLGGMAFILGDKRDQEVDGKVIQQLAGRCAISLCGKLGLRGTFGALNSCDIYIGNDTGLSHAAAALGMPALSIFKPWNSSFTKNRPYGPRGSYVCEWPGTDAIDAVWDWIMHELQQPDNRKKRKRK